jgi:CDGSH-type Zn-finger protein
MPEANHALRDLAGRAEHFATALDASRDDQLMRVASRLRDSVVRPLRQVQPPLTPGTEPRSPTEAKPSQPVDEAMFELARNATAMAVDQPGAPALIEAAAALQDLALAVAAGPAAVQRLAQFQGQVAGLESRVQVARDGPYLVTNPAELRDWLGLSIQTRPLMALCRCGASVLKPLCDGSHGRTGFTAAKDPNRVPDRLDTYVGQQVTILDNRGTYQHAGYCRAGTGTPRPGRPAPASPPSPRHRRRNDACPTCPPRASPSASTRTSRACSANETSDR